MSAPEEKKAAAAPSLAETQALFWKALRGEVEDASALEGVFVSRGALSGPERVDIYRDMFWWRQSDALAAGVPMLAMLFDHHDFFDLARAFLTEHPSSHFDLGTLARELPAYLKTRTDLRADLSDLALLEWTRDRVFFAAAVEPVEASALAALGEELVNARFELTPALEVLTLGHGVAALWQALEDGTEVPDVDARPEVIAVWRRGFEVVHGPLSAMEADAIVRARAGQSVAEICEAFVELENPAQAAFEALGSWVQEGWITAVR